MKKSIFVLLLAGCLSLAGNAQYYVPGSFLNGTNATISNTHSPSVNAEALGRYLEVPVSPYTGIADINVPLYEIQTKGLKLPISLSYHSNGVKVEETASWVGLGWSLNAGGVVSRVVNDLPDEWTHNTSCPSTVPVSSTIITQGGVSL